MQPIVVSQTGDGDFKSISKAVEAAEPGSTIYIKSGFYEEAIVVSKPLSLIGDPNGLAVITNSNFALLTVLSTELKMAHLALVSGMRLPSVKIVDSIVHFNDSILWALDTFLKDSNPSLLPARALVDESFLGASMRNSIAIGSMIADLLGFSKREPDGLLPPSGHYAALGRRRENSAPAEAEREKASATVSAPLSDVLVRNGSELNVRDSFIGMAGFVARERSSMSFASSRLDYAALTSLEKSEATFCACTILSEENRATKECVKDPEPGRTTQAEMIPARNPMKREREAVLLLWMKELVARTRRPLGGRNEAEAQTA